MSRTGRAGRAATVPFRTGAALGALLALAACGHAPEPVTVGEPASLSAPAAPTPTPGPASSPVSDGANPAPVPTLPGARQRSPELFDGNGCTKLRPDQVTCANRAQEIDAAAAGATPGDWRNLAGFVGRGWSSDVSRNASVVLPESVTSAHAGLWSASGLVRNETINIVGTLTVTATLVDAAGAVLDTVSAASPVHAVRPGEPAPFAVASRRVDAASVAGVRWSTSTATEGGGTPRDIELVTYWVRSPSSGNRVETDAHRDPSGLPLSLLVYGAVTNRGSAPAARPAVVVAWLDASGRVVGVTEHAGVDDQGREGSSLAEGASLDFYAELTDPATAGVASASTPMLWGLGR